MKKVFKIIGYGILGVIGLSIGVLAIVFPCILQDLTGNANYLWFYTPHVIALIWFAGDFIYEEIE